MVNKNYDTRIEENLKIESEYLRGLKTISYDELVDMLNDEKNLYQIEFYDKLDNLNDIHYSCISILKNNDTSTVKEYLSVDQDAKDIYNSMTETLIRKNANFVFQVFTNYSGYYELACNVGINILVFPREIIKDFMVSAVEYSDKRPSDISCIVGNKELFFPCSLSNEELEKRKLINYHK